MKSEHLILFNVEQARNLSKFQHDSNMIFFDLKNIHDTEGNEKGMKNKIRKYPKQILIFLFKKVKKRQKGYNEM